MSPTEAPARSLEQRMDALEYANVIRSGRAELKRDLKARRANVVDVLLAPPDVAKTMKVVALLLATPKLGRVKVDAEMRRLCISPRKTVEGLSERQRCGLVAALLRRDLSAPPPHNTPSLGTMTDAQHMQALALANGTRIARAELRESVAAGEQSVADVLRDVPACAESMTLGALLGAQRHWGDQRVSRLLRSLHLSERKRLGTLTARQAREIVGALSPESVDA